MTARKASPRPPSNAPARKAGTKTVAAKARKPMPTPEKTKPPNGTGEAPPVTPVFIGTVADPTPNENYGIEGVIGGLPVPEHR